MAGVEGMLWFLKVHVFELPPRTVPSVTKVELDAIFERSYSVAQNGIVRESPKFLPLLSGIRLLARVIQRDFPSFDPHFENEGWDRMKRAIEVRNRVTHPKSVSDLDVSLDDVANSRAAFFWAVAFLLRAGAVGAFGPLPADPTPS
jgi:hypothetical protein